MSMNSVAQALTTLLVVCLFAVALGCPGRPSVDPVAISDFKLKLPDRDGPSGCDESERPKDVGCTTLCKPCLTSFCVDGKWVREKIEFGEECDPLDLDFPPSGCPRTQSGFCPAECHICF